MLMQVFFSTIHFRHFDFVEWFLTNSSSNNLFDILSIKDFLDDFLMCLCILLISLKMLSVFVFHNQYFYHYDLIHQLLLQVCIYENKDQSCSLKQCIMFAYFLLRMHLLLNLLLFVL